MSKIDRDEAEELLFEIVSTPSVSGNEQRVAEKLVEFFEENGRDAWIDEMGNVRSPGNQVLLTSHIDTVPGKLEVKIEEGFLHGRGSVDAKGPSVAMAVASIETGASFAGVVREETDSEGAGYLIQDREPPEYLINGEPTGADGLALGYRGSLVGEYSVEREMFHSARPEPNAIQKAIREWRTLEENFSDGEGFESIELKPLKIEGGEKNGLSTAAEIQFQVRIPPSRKIDELKNKIEEKLSGSVKWDRSVPGVMESQRTEIARAFRSTIREKEKEPRMVRKTGTCDMNRYSESWQCPMATYGPGNSDLDHTPNEKLSLEDFHLSVEVLKSLVKKLSN